MCGSEAFLVTKEQVPSTPANLFYEVNNTPVLLPSLLVQDEYKFAESRVKVLQDGGSQRSCVQKEVSRKLGCEVLELKSLTVRGFGGKAFQKTLRDRVALRNIKGTFPIVAETLESCTICNQTIQSPTERIRQSSTQIAPRMLGCKWKL